MASQLPHFRTVNGVQQLIVDGDPFLVRGGELQNSSFSSSQYMQKIWPRLVALNLNTVLASVAWEQIESKEDEFDFSDVSRLIEAARSHGLRLIILWFGTWKNGMSTYAPAWVKQDVQRFSRAWIRSEDGTLRPGDLVSPFSLEAVKADARAFSALMQHIKLIDEDHNTVIMVQVENEVGVLGDSRDRSDLAEGIWNQPVPSQLTQLLRERKDGSLISYPSTTLCVESAAHSVKVEWTELTRDVLVAEEIFMAYHYAKYVETVTSAGKAVYPLPMFTNVWQNYSSETSDSGVDVPAVVAGGGRPGDYPAGGAVPRVLDIWKATAPSLNLIAPDIYLNDYAKTCAIYRQCGQPLLVPEQRRDEYGARRIWLAFGSYQAIGTAPFGIDTVDPGESPFPTHYDLLKKVSGEVTRAQIHGRMAGFVFDDLVDGKEDPSPSQSLSLGGWNLTIERSHVFGKPSAGSGLVIHRGGNEFLLVGWGFQVRFDRPGANFIGLLRFHEQDVVDGQFRTIRWLNGDETRSGRLAVMPSHNPDYGDFPISITIPAETGIAVVEPYALFPKDFVTQDGSKSFKSKL